VEGLTGTCLAQLGSARRCEFDDTLSKAEASRRIDELQQRTGRGAHPARPNERR